MSMNHVMTDIETMGKNPNAPIVAMQTSRGEHLIGWLASQTDMLAEDWEVA